MENEPPSDPVEQDQEYAAQLRQARLQEIRARSAGGMGGMLEKEAGKKVEKLKKLAKMAGGSVQGAQGLWIILLVMAVAKDILDASTLGAFDLLDWAVDISMGVGFFLAAGKSKLDVTWRFLSSAVSFAIEAVLGFVPAWTLSVLFMWWKAKH